MAAKKGNLPADRVSFVVDGAAPPSSVAEGSLENQATFACPFSIAFGDPWTQLRIFVDLGTNERELLVGAGTRLPVLVERSLVQSSAHVEAHKRGSGEGAGAPLCGEVTVKELDATGPEVVARVELAGTYRSPFGNTVAVVGELRAKTGAKKGAQATPLPAWDPDVPNTPAALLRRSIVEGTKLRCVARGGGIGLGTVGK